MRKRIIITTLVLVIAQVGILFAQEKNSPSISSSGNKVLAVDSKDNASHVALISSANSNEESILNFDIDPSKMVVYIVDGVEVDIEYLSSIDPYDVVNINVIRDEAICNLFAPRTGGILQFTTKSKSILNQTLQREKQRQIELREKDRKEGIIKVR
ncbi:MAG: hypothetical protein MJZ16_04320 [Bacteroidales bacterium]|nr:hypothetical protein [Bacteroidales bacterium]